MGHDQRSVAAAVGPHLQRVAQRTVAGGALRVEVHEVDFGGLAGGEFARVVGGEQAARLLGMQFQTDRAVRRVDAADGRLDLLSLADIGEGAERRSKPQTAARIDRIELFGGFGARSDGAVHGERCDLAPLGGVDAQLFGEGAGAVGRVERYFDCRFLARTDWPFGEFGHRAAAGGHHVEDHDGFVGAVLARERVAYAALGFGNRAEVP